MKLTAEFVGLQPTEIPGFVFRLYNIVGEHRLSGSTVTVDTLVKEGIAVPDLDKKQLREELAALADYLK